jgi:sugar phosphate isomerase/epimerase
MNPAAVIVAELYTIRDHLQDADAIAAGLQRVREIGYEGVELAGLAPIEPVQLARLLGDAGLVASSAHVRWERVRDEPDAVVEDCQTWGCDHVAVGMTPAEPRDAAGYARFGAEAGEVAVRLRSNGIRLSYHNHSFEMERFGARSGLEILFEAGGPLLGAQLDTYWIQHGGASPGGWIRRLRGRVPSIHIKDMVIVDGEPAMAEIGEGNLDWADVLGACREAETELLIVEQDFCRGDPFESLATSRRNLARLGAG